MMASKAPESKPPPRPKSDEETFLAPPPPDRNCRGQSERPSDEKCSGAKGPVPQNDKFTPPPTWSAVRSSQDFTTGGLTRMKESSSQKTSALISASPTKEQTQSEDKMNQKNVTERDNTQDSQQQQQQQPHNQSSNGAEANSRKRSSTPEDGGNAGDAMNSKGTGLPKELTSKFGPLKCDLCNVSVNSTVQARMHYTGKQHDKKVNQFLANWSQETGQPIPKRVKETAAAKKAALEPKDLYCNVCDLALTSAQHAQQHYMGKNHLRAMQGRSSKASGKWQRQGDAAAKGVGDPFSTDPLGLKDSPNAPPSKKGRFYCELCQVMATSQDQLDMHLKGAKHRKAEKAAGVATKPSPWTGGNVVAGSAIPPPAASDSILASVIKTDDAMSRKPGIKDYSIYRTPSGDYYCGICTVICNRADVFHTHMISKKHAKREKILKEKAAMEGDDNAETFLSNLKKTITGNVEKVSSNLFFCKLCDLSVNSKEELERHIATEQHMDKVGKSDPYKCHVCNLSLESEEHIALHCTQEEHKKKLQQDS